jgi:hypothetical protein
MIARNPASSVSGAKTVDGTGVDVFSPATVIITIWPGATSSGSGRRYPAWGRVVCANAANVAATQLK